MSNRKIVRIDKQANTAAEADSREPDLLDRLLGGDAALAERFAAAQPSGRYAAPEEIAAAAVWLCSDAASFVLGHSMVIDGGQTT